ncbi:hypothetical protein Z517_06465 [Fonsecaea pedrosoi CBS 271.37]|uniref:Cytochrome P450 n=1 Tax=Fonsecaea pedrosoi CBS 271.37 TaxID=1442368 RepID=A0A0D2GMT2_9EURO|nr:uncharacterized protein Z517_06465 [Fonsecaea pedrosoi CBS 271.37]KIW79850.1 hypothetical protein Z517_06465 [Fonsecaea pedrosoi CBS 271.37]
MFTMMDRKQHAERKKMISKSYTKSTILSSGALRETLNVLVSEQLLPLIEESSTTRIPIEVCDLNRAYAMDIFTSYQYGSSLKTTFIQDMKRRQWYFTRYFRSRPYFFAMTEMPGFLTLLSRLSAPFRARSIKKALNELENWNLEMCDKAVGLIIAEESSGIGIAKREYPVILAQLYVSLQRLHSEITDLSSPQKQSAYPFRYELASEMFDHNLGAHETIGNAISCIQFELSRHPKVQEKLRTELQKLVPIQSSCRGGSEILLPSLQAVDSCPFLNAVILETFRVWPVARTRPRLSPTVCSLEGYGNIPRHVKIQVYPYTLHRNVDVFSEPDAWIPERWTCSGPEKVETMRKWLLPFGGGERMCIGNHFANITTKYLIAAIYTKYTSTVVFQRDMNLTDGFIAGPQGGKLTLQFQHA